MFRLSHVSDRLSTLHIQIDPGDPKAEKKEAQKGHDGVNKHYKLDKRKVALTKSVIQMWELEKASLHSATEVVPIYLEKATRGCQETSGRFRSESQNRAAEKGGKTKAIMDTINSDSLLGLLERCSTI